MELNFKPLGAVESVDEIPENAKLLIEDNGKIRRAPAVLNNNGEKVFVYDATYLWDNSRKELPYEEAVELLKEFKNNDVIVFKINAGGSACGSGTLSMWEVSSEYGDDDKTIISEDFQGIIPLYYTYFFMVLLRINHETKEAILAIEGTR